VRAAVSPYRPGQPLLTEPPRLAEELVSFVAPNSPEADQYRTVRHVLERLHHDSGFRVVAVASPGPGEGKTLTTLNLAGSLAQSPGARVLVIDADLHRPSVAERLGLAQARTPGLAEAIMNGGYPLAQIARRLDSLNISVLVAGSPHGAPYELLASPRFEALLGEARLLYDYVLVDTPPVVPLTDSRQLGRLVDGYLIVVAAHRTPRRLLREAINLLDSTKIVGVVFNGDDRPLNSYSGYYAAYQPPSRSSSGPAELWQRALKLGRQA
jgi:capsular exopolysaccharide synthesis family protein